MPKSNVEIFRCVFECVCVVSPPDNAKNFRAPEVKSSAVQSRAKSPLAERVAEPKSTRKRKCACRKIARNSHQDS